jgi:aryl-alcohol dehydrogenase-like predicted oxidoreductase
LTTRNVEIAVLATCQKIGAALVAFSPLARAFLTAKLLNVDELDAKDIRRSMPRYAPDNHALNLAVLPALQTLAEQAGCTPAQLALAWLLHQGAHVVPIPGTTQLAHLHENLRAADVKLTPELLSRLNALLPHQRMQGGRYGAQAQSEVDTEEFVN